MQRLYSPKNKNRENLYKTSGATYGAGNFISSVFVLIDSSYYHWSMGENWSTFFVR